MKNILLVNFSLAMGGIENMIWNFCLYYKGRGYRVEVLCFESGGAFIEKLRRENIAVTVIEKKEGLDYSLVLKLVSFLRKKNYDVIHTNNYATWLYITIASALSLKFFRIVHTEHSLVTDHIKRRLYLERILSLFTYKIVTVSGSVNRYLAELGKINPTRLEVIHNGINLDKFKSSPSVREKIRARYGFSEETIVVGAIGRLVEVKDHETLILAACKLIQKNPDYVFVIIGEGELKDRLNSMVKSAGLEDKILLLGEQHNIYELLNMFDIYIMTSLSEGFSIGLMEAMSTELPVIVTEVGGNREIITNGENGMYIIPKDIDGISETIDSLARNSPLRKQIAKNARQTIEKEFSELKMYKSYEKLYFK